MPAHGPGTEVARRSELRISSVRTPSRTRFKFSGPGHRNPSQLPRLAMGRVAVTNGTGSSYLSLQPFPWPRFTPYALYDCLLVRRAT